MKTKERSPHTLLREALDNLDKANLKLSAAAVKATWNGQHPIAATASFVLAGDILPRIERIQKMLGGRQ